MLGRELRSGLHQRHFRGYRRGVPAAQSGNDGAYQVVAEQLETFLSRQRERARPVPRFVDREFRDYLTRGIPEHGFLRLHCSSCGNDRILPFSCKRRGWCPSCGGRRMADTAAWLVDRVFPMVPVRQWVLSLPFKLRYRAAYDSKLMADILNIFIRSVFGGLRRRARESLGLKQSQCGAVTFVQRFGSSANLHVPCKETARSEAIPKRAVSFCGGILTEPRLRSRTCRQRNGYGHHRSPDSYPALEN